MKWLGVKRLNKEFLELQVCRRVKYEIDVLNSLK